MSKRPTRREMLSIGSIVAASSSASLFAAPRTDPATAPRATPTFRYCLNTSTIRGQKLPILEEAKLAAKAGYQAIEPWINELDDHQKSGGTLEALGGDIQALGLEIPSAIGFFEWCVDDPARRQNALDEAKRICEKVKAIGGKRIAAPPLGAVDQANIEPARLAERYRALLELAEPFGIIPELEIWGFSQTLGRLDLAAEVAIRADHPNACLLADVYHLYRGGSSFDAIRLLSGQAFPVFHVNDYASSLPRETIKDSDRIFPGDGDAPLTPLFQTLATNGFQGFLSIELFNESYYKQDPFTVLKTGLEKLKAKTATAIRS